MADNPALKQALLERAKRELAKRKGGSVVDRARELGMAALDNVVGIGEVDTPGERLGVTIRDSINAAESGARNTLATIADMPGMAVNFLGGKAADLGQRAGLLSPAVAEQAKASLARGPFGSGTTAREGVNMLTGGSLDYEPQTAVGEYARTVGEFLPGAAGGFVPFALAPGVASEFAGQKTEGMTFPDWVPGLGGSNVEPWARGGAALASPSLLNLGRRVVTPNSADPARIASAERLRQEGIAITAGQKTGNRLLTFREQGARNTADTLADQNKQFTAAALRRIGARDPETLQPATRATPEVLRLAKKDIGNLFDEVAESAFISVDDELARKVREAAATYANMTNKNQAAPLVKNTLAKIEDALTSGKPVSGKEYLSWRSELSEATVGGGPLANAARRYIDALDDAMGRSIKNPEIAQKYGQARQQWRDFLAIRDAASMAGEETAAGIISPQNLRGKLTTGGGKSSYATGDRDLGNLVRDANSVIPRISDPQQDMMIARTVGDIATGGTAAGGLTFALTRDPTLAGAAGSLGALAPVLANRAVGSNPAQAYLANQLMPGRNPALSFGLLGATAASLGQR